MISFDAVYERVVPKYREPHRFYHTESHLRKMMHFWNVTLDDTRKLETHLLGGIAILYHDVVYDPTSQTNEEASVAVMKNDLWPQLTSKQLDWVSDAIMETKHLPSSSNNYWHNLICDLDLLVLAGSGPEYRRYMWQVRQEYINYELKNFLWGRTQLLKSFLDRETIFKTGHFPDSEQLARKNLQWELNEIETGHPYD